MDVLNRLGSALSPLGRSGRIDGLLALGSLWLLAQLAFAQTLHTSDAWILVGPATLLALWLFIATSIRRLHDLDMSGWFLLVYLVIPLAAIVREGIDSGLGTFSSVDHGFELFDLAARIVFVLWLGLVQGSAGPNRYGPAPTHSWRLAR